MSKTKKELIQEADSILENIDRLNVSMSSPYFARSQAALAHMARGSMRDLVKNMKDYIKESE